MPVRSAAILITLSVAASGCVSLVSLGAADAGSDAEDEPVGRDATEPTDGAVKADGRVTDGGGLKCPAFQPAVGSSCDSEVEDTVCEYGKCATGAGGAGRIRCENDVWESLGTGCGGGTDADPDAPPADCRVGEFGDAKGICSSDDSFFVSASADCTGAKQFLSTFQTDEQCGTGSSNTAKYSCCASAPAGTSSGSFQNANDVCQSDSSSFVMAETACAMGNADIIDFVPNESCAVGSSSGATYTCNP